MLKKILLVLLLIISAFTLVSCDKKIDSDFHTALQEKYLAGDATKASDFSMGGEELSRPDPIHLEWKGSNNTYVITIKEKDSGEELIYDSSETSLDVYNLKVNEEYIWYVDGKEQGEFKTPEILRNLYIDGLTNCRDIGGYKIDGGYVKQGMLFRTSRLNENYTGEVLITEKGIEQIKALGIKTELDLRKIDETESGLEQAGITQSAVDGVNYISIPMATGGNYLQLNRKILKDIFAILADENNYPIMFHCSIGTDRTGVVAFMVNALLGVSVEDLYHDYLFSNFGNIGGMRSASTIDDYIQKVSINEMPTLKENVYQYLLNAGVSEEHLNKVIEIMTEKK